MKYEDLIFFITDLSRTIPGNAVKLLWHLIRVAIKDGSNELRLSTVDLSAATEMHRDTVRKAAQELNNVILVTPVDGVGYVFHLPHGWFGETRGLFTGLEAVDNFCELPGKPTATCRENQQLPAWNPGSSGGSFRQMFAQAVEKPGSYLSGKPTATPYSCLESQQLATQNQQLSATPLESNRIEMLASAGDLRDLVDRIVHVDAVENHQQEDAAILRDMIREYRLNFGQDFLASKPADDMIIARCLAAADIDQLAKTLLGMADAKIPPGDRDGWFLTLFLNKIHGVHKELTAERLRLRHARKQPRRTMNLEFGPQLVHQATAAVAGMR